MLSFTSSIAKEVGKLSSGDVAAAIIPNSSVKNAQPCNSPMLREDLTGVLFLVDTGAAASVYPRSKLLLSQLLSMQPHNSIGSFISTASGAELPVQGTVHLQPEFAGLKHPHTFLVTEVN